MSDFDKRAGAIYKALVFVDLSKPVPLKEVIDYVEELTSEDRDFIKQVLQTEVDEGRIQYIRSIN